LGALRFHRLKHPKEMGALEVEAFLRYLATERKVSASTHKIALSALLYLYQEILNIELPWMNKPVRPASHLRIPAVLTQDEIREIFAQLDGAHGLFARLLYGAGMRLMEELR
jgi:site-specific recombinase XerD